MVDISTLKIGDKVYYKPDYYDEDRYDNGMIKEIPDHTLVQVRVVFHCEGNWSNFKNYTGQLTPIKDLYLGWKH